MNEFETATQEVVYEWAAAATLSGWWAWAAALAAVAGLLFVTQWLYRRDTVEQSPGIRGTLITLRLTVLLALVFFFFGLQRRTQQRIERPSEVAVLVDTSQSMALADGSDTGPTSDTAAIASGGADGAGGAGSAAEPANRSRAEQAVQILTQPGQLLDRLQAQHRVTVYAFDQDSAPRELAVATAGGANPADAGDSADAVNSADAVDSASTVAASGPADAARSRGAAGGISAAAVLGAVLVAALIGLCLLAILWGLTGRLSAIDYPLVAAAVLLPLAIALLGGSWAVHTDRSLAGLIGLANDSPTVAQWASDSATVERSADQAGQPAELPAAGAAGAPSGGALAGADASSGDDWSTALAASGSESRIGDALRGVLAQHDPSTLAGIVLLTDGQARGGISSSSAATLARRSEVAIYPLGLGSSRPPTNVRIVDLDVPRRVYPGDRFTLSAVLQGSGARDVETEVQLWDAADGTDIQHAGVLQTQSVRLPADGTLVPLRFELVPEQVGKRQLMVRLVPPGDDQNPADDARSGQYEVVSRKLRVLAIAGGPTRDFQFVRNLFQREESIELDVWLQSVRDPLVQPGNGVLDEFPASVEALFEYDAILAFDPDWLAVPAERMQLLQRWVSEQAGGLVIVAGQTYLPQWSRSRTDPRVTILSGLFPVELAVRNPLLSGGRQGGEAAIELQFSPEAARADFLMIASDPQESAEVWGQFAGVYDSVGVKDAKPGARVYAYFADPTALVGGTYPVYMASQFYGAGRTFFQASGEMWRLRRDSDSYFDLYYTKLVRWAAEGRLLRDSARGVLLVDQPRANVGDTITVRAVLSDEQFQPLQADRVNANLLAPGGQISPLELLPVAGDAQAGTFSGRFTARSAGDYALHLNVDDAVLTQTVHASLPAVELERPQRNDQDLQFVASTSGGVYFPIDGPESARSAIDRLVAEVHPQPQVTILPGTPDSQFTQRRNASLLWLIATALTFEWVVRRLNRLA